MIRPVIAGFSLLMMALCASACSQAPANNGYYYAPDMFAGYDSGTLGQNDVVTAKDVTATSDAVSTDIEADTSCSCAGLECGSPPGCPDTDCSPCPKGSVCSDNICNPDPNFSCGPQDCGDILGFEGLNCGECAEGMKCLNNFCISTCVCSDLGYECGENLPGCDPATCGDCAPGKLCQDHLCVDNPKCACKPGMCGVPPGCSANCGACGTGQKCVSNQCVGGDTCTCTGIQCGFAKPSCANSCGICQVNEYCAGNTCKLDDPGVKKKFGEPCGPSEKCPVPMQGATQFAQKQFLECLDNQCAGGLCVQGVCTQKCTITADLTNNETNGPGADGIQDKTEPNPCTGAVAGPAGSEFRCVEQNSLAQVGAGMTYAVCLPGSNFKSCKASADCALGELCRVTPILGDFQARCGPRIHNPAGSAGALASQACNDDPLSDTVALCETGWCSPIGCVALCKANADCKTAPGGCVQGKCSANGASCGSDADCPTWVCKSGIKFSNDSLTTFSACQPQ